jgi:hypothetical protein
MSTKDENASNPKSCWSKAEGDEPVFVLRANDPIAPMAVRIWASLNRQLRGDGVKSCSAWQVACDMEAWYEHMYGAPKYDPNK